MQNEVIYLQKIVSKLKRLIEDEIDNNNIHNGLLYLSCLTKIEFNFYYNYRDADVENYINNISRLLFKDITIYKAEDNKIALIDSVSWDYHGLTQQYLRAMMHMDFDILYVIIGEGTKCTRIIEELNKYKRAKIIHIPRYRSIERQIRVLYKEICDFRPSRIFLHSFEIIDSIVLKTLKSPITFRIDLGDHHCWPGIDSTNFIIGFRKWGLVLCNSIKKVSEEKLLLLPYYPILNDENDYNGLPPIVEGKVLIFSGGALYKTMDDKQTFFKIMHRIVLENPNVLVLFACRGDDNALKKYIRKNNLDNRIILIGYRKDLGKVMDHIDLYLNTYPLGGGLMVQYAAEKSVPILSMISNDIIEYYDFEEIGYSYKTEYDNLEEFHQEANKLIGDKKYRMVIGNLIHQNTPQKNLFNTMFSNILNSGKGVVFSFDNNQNIYNFEEQRTNFRTIVLENNLRELSSVLFKVFNFKMFLLFPYRMVINGCFEWVGYKIRKIIPPVAAKGCNICNRR
jgi:hypothetical protein